MSRRFAKRARLSRNYFCSVILTVEHHQDFRGRRTTTTSPQFRSLVRLKFPDSIRVLSNSFFAELDQMVSDGQQTDVQPVVDQAPETAR